jgi:putative MFS transporter
MESRLTTAAMTALIPAVETPLNTLIKPINIPRDAAEQPESVEQIALITARFNRLPASRYMWQLIALLSLCGFFEIYEIALTSTLSPGLIRAGEFNADAKGLFGLTDQASFAAATFLGLFIGTSSFAAVADRFGRRSILIGSLAWYIAATAVMAAQGTDNCPRTLPTASPKVLSCRVRLFR